MRRSSARLLAFALAFVAVAACGGKIASDGTGPSSAPASSEGSGDGTTPPPASFTPPPAPPAPAPSASPPPVAACPPTPPAEGTDCGWQYGLPCDYAIARIGDVCGIQCRCSSAQSEPNHWTCFDIGCER